MYGICILYADQGYSVVVSSYDKLTYENLIYSIRQGRRGADPLSDIFPINFPMLLDLTFFRRDQIWFAEKDEKSCATELYSLASFSPRKGENIRKGYLQGRFGAIPFIGGDGLWQE